MKPAIRYAVAIGLAATQLFAVAAGAADSTPVKQNKDKVSTLPALNNCETLRTVQFDPSVVTPLRAKRGFVTQVLLGPGEVIIDKRGGDADGWEVTDIPNSPMLTVKPRLSANNSNLIVTTSQRVYVISLLVLPDHSPCSGNWQLIFNIPAPPVLAVIRETPQMAAAALKQALKDVPAPRNWNYSMQPLPGSEDITPNEIYDDGRFTFIRFSGNRELPSVFRVTSDGEEVIVDRHMKGRDLMVIHEMGRRFVLRLDKQVVGLWNDSFDIDGVPPVAGTVSAKVQRITNGREFGDE